MTRKTVRAAAVVVAVALMLVFASGATGQAEFLVFIGNGAVPYDVSEVANTTPTVTVPVTLSRASQTQVTVDWHTESAWLPHTASETGQHVDYRAASGTVVFAPGEKAKTVNISIFDDGIAELDESFLVALSNPVGADIGVPGDFWTHGAVVTIHDNEPGAFIGEGAYTLYTDEGDTGTTSFAIPVYLNYASTAPVSVNWETRDDDLAQNHATAGQDYEAASGTVTFDPGETSKNVDIRITGDTAVEPDEYFLVSITNVVGAQKGVSWDGWLLGATVAIRDNDQAPPPGEPAPLNVTATGSQSFGSSAPDFSHSQSLPDGISVSGTLVCTGLDGGTAISPSLAVGSYTIDGSTCSGLSLSGSGASGYTLAYIGGPFTVRAPSDVVVTATGSQSAGSSSPVFEHSENLPAGISISGTLTCTGLSGGGAISSSLAAGSYTIDGSSCSGLSLSGAGASGYGIVYVGGAFTVSEPAGPCLIVSPSAVDYGTHPFSGPNQLEVDEKVVTVKSCATGGASERVSVVGTEPAGPSGTWELGSAQDAFCPALNRLSLELNSLAAGDRVTQWVTTSASFLPVTWAPDEAKDFRLILVMPCQGSHGAGETKTTLITFTAVVP